MWCMVTDAAGVSHAHVSHAWKGLENCIMTDQMNRCDEGMNRKRLTCQHLENSKHVC